MYKQQATMQPHKVASPRMRLVLATGTVEGGAWNRLVELLSYLEGKSIACDLITYDDPALDVVSGIQNLSIHSFRPAKRGTRALASAVENMLSTFSWEDDVPVWLGSYAANAGVGLARAKTHVRAPVQMFAFLRGAEVERARMNMKENGDPVLSRAIRLWSHKQATRTMLTSSDLLIAQTDVGLRAIGQNFRRHMPKESVILPNNITASWIREKIQDVETYAEPYTDGPLRIAFLGRLNMKVKGVDTLLDACQRLSNQVAFHLDIIGGGGDEAEVRQRLTHPCFAENVTMHGWLTNPLPVLAQAHVVVVPSRADPLPNVVLEAMALQRAVFGSDVDGIPVMLGHPELLFPPGDEVALANRLLSYASSPTFRESVRRMIDEQAAKFRFNWGARFESILYKYHPHLNDINTIAT